MEHRPKKSEDSKSANQFDTRFDLDALLHPAKAFAHPMDVMRDHDLTLNEKRAILASWASDACAVEAAPDLRPNGSGSFVRWDEIMDALRALDRETEAQAKAPPHYKQVLAKKAAGLLGTPSRSGDSGSQRGMLN